MPSVPWCNEWGRSHEVKNLFIVDGSILVTCGGVQGPDAHASR